MSIGNEPAYPAGTGLDGTWLDSATCKQWKPYNGLTKRELFAAMAMQGLSANAHQSLATANVSLIAQYAVAQADALLLELSKEPPHE